MNSIISSPRTQPIAPPEESQPISYADLERAALRVGCIQQAWRLPNHPRNRFRLLVNLGEERPRMIISDLPGLSEEDVRPGRLVTVVTNIAHKQIGNYTSQGVLLTGYRDEACTRPVLIVPAEDAHIGSQVR